ncbi:hypothetical protein F5882DRAFT_50737 [Hyaloscypha sp. PMI_1271]|nr:hypothetical protein F5882DRAFT_50737 [Hyaloscypha sp. PMI_1271]
MGQFSLSCLSRAKTADEITKAMRVYEAIRKPRAVKLKNASEESGVEKHYPDSKKQRERDAQMKMVIDTHLAEIPKRGEKNSHPCVWIMGHDAVGYANIELDRVFRKKNGVAPERP